MLKFYAREGLARLPGVPPIIGVAARYLGREFVPASKDSPPSYPAIREGFSCEPGSLLADVAAKHCRKGAFWPADRATAEACGVPFVEVEFADGEFVAKKRASVKAAE